MVSLEKIHKVSYEVCAEVERAERMHPPLHSAHEAYSVLLEEVDELWDEVKKNPKKDPHCIARRRTEAVQVAAMAMRFIIDVCDKEAQVQMPDAEAGCMMDAPSSAPKFEREPCHHQWAQDPLHREGLVCIACGATQYYTG